MDNAKLQCGKHGRNTFFRRISAHTNCQEKLTSDTLKCQFLYFFSNDFTEYKYTTLDDYGSFSNITKIQKKEQNGISIWTIGDQNYVLFKSKDYFILKNYEKVFTLIKNYDDYWSKEIEVVANYEASSYKKNGFNRFDEYNLLYLDFTPWISESGNSGIEESITVNSQKLFSSFRI